MVEKFRMRSAIDFGKPLRRDAVQNWLKLPRDAHIQFFFDNFVELSTTLHLRLLAEIVGKKLFVVDSLFGKLQHRSAELFPRC